MKEGENNASPPQGETELGRYIREVNEQIGSAFWVGPDVGIGQSFVVAPGQVGYALTILKKESLPPLRDLQQDLRHIVRCSTRSTLAQVGLEAYPELGDITNEDWEKLKHGEDIRVPVFLINHGQRSVEADEGEGLFRFFLEAPGRLERRELLEKIESGGIVLEGVYGENWWLCDFTGTRCASDEKENGVTIVLPYDDKKRLWTFPGKGPLHVEHRGDLEHVLEPVPDGYSPDFFVAQTTARVYMNDVYAIVLSGVYDNTGQRPIMSTLIDRGFDGPIRVEVSDHAHLAKQKPYVFMSVYPVS